MLDLVRDAANPIAIATTVVIMDLNLVAKGSAVRLSYFITTLEHVAIAVLSHRRSAPRISAPEKRAADERTGVARRRVAHQRSAPLNSPPE